LPRNKNQRKSLSRTREIFGGGFGSEMESACEKKDMLVALLVSPLNPSCPPAAGGQGQESPFNLNTYHHDNNLVTLSEANLFISLIPV